MRVSGSDPQPTAHNWLGMTQRRPSMHARSPAGDAARRAGSGNGNHNLPDLRVRLEVLVRRRSVCERKRLIEKDGTVATVLPTHCGSTGMSIPPLRTRSPVNRRAIWPSAEMGQATGGSRAASHACGLSWVAWSPASDPSRFPRARAMRASCHSHPAEPCEAGGWPAQYTPGINRKVRAQYAAYTSPNCAWSNRSSAWMRARRGGTRSAANNTPSPERNARPHPSALTSSPR